jgi:hypothetical protein
VKRRTALLGGAALGMLALASGAHALLVRSGAACPLDAPSTEALEKQRQRALPALRGQGMAPSGEAFGFALGVTTRPSFLATSAQDGEACEEELEGALVRCDGPRGELVARFDPNGTLVGADRMRYVVEVEDATMIFRELAKADATRLGTPTRTWGESSEAFLGQPLHQVGASYRFEDVAVDLSVTHLGTGRIAIREQVRAIPRVPARGG